MSTLPRGIQVARRPSGLYYRVVVKRKDYKADKYFKDLAEAKEFLALSKAKKGKELIYSITEKEKDERTNDDKNFSFGYFVDLYIEDYINSKKIETELQKRNRTNKLSFLRTIKNCSVLDRRITFEEKEILGIDVETDKKVYRKFGGLDIRFIKAIDINNYIKARLKFIKPISVAREVTYISNVFNKLQYFNEDLADLQNPTRNYDKDLLQNTITKREKIISEDEEKRFFEVLQSKENKELYKIAKVSILTAMRRSEILTLAPEQIKENFIQLTHTKSGKPRKVYLTKEAKDYIKTLTPFSNEKYFKYTISGFDRVFREVMFKANLNNIHFHDLRRTNISRLLTRLGGDNTILAAEILGFSSMRKFEELHGNEIPKEPKTQFQAMQSFGHSSAQITKGYYNIVFKPLETKKTEPEG